VRRREQLRLAARQRANAALCGLPLTDYLALSRCARKARLRAALHAAAAQFQVVGFGPFRLPGERRRMARALLETRQMLKEADRG
jgi:hypothetical protein